MWSLGGRSTVPFKMALGWKQLSVGGRVCVCEGERVVLKSRNRGSSRGRAASSTASARPTSTGVYHAALASACAMKTSPHRSLSLSLSLSTSEYQPCFNTWSPFLYYDHTIIPIPHSSILLCALWLYLLSSPRPTNPLPLDNPSLFPLPVERNRLS